MLQVRETGFLALLPALRPRASFFLGVHCSAFGKQELCSLDFAVARRVVQRRQTSGAFPEPSAAVAGPPEADAAGDDERSAQLSSTHSIDKRTMNVLSTSSKLLKAKYIHKHTEQVSIYILFPTNCLQRNDVYIFDLQKLKRLLKQSHQVQPVNNQYQ